MESFSLPVSHHGGSHGVELYRLRARLSRLGPLVQIPIGLPRSRRTYDIHQPSSIDHLLDAVAVDPEQNLPYWAEIWPSGIALADAILEDREALRGQRVLEIGSGLGITATAALAAEAKLTVTDYDSTSLLLCRYNTLRNTGRQPRTLQSNWRRPTPALFNIAGDGFDVVLAADVLYESRDLGPLLAVINRLVSPTGILWLAEPERTVAATFLNTLRRGGWSSVHDVHDGPWADPRDADVRVGTHRLRRVQPDHP